MKKPTESSGNVHSFFPKLCMCVSEWMDDAWKWLPVHESLVKKIVCSVKFSVKE